MYKIEFIKEGDIQGDIVTLETAQLLRRLGFNKPTFYYYLEIDTPFNNKGLKRVKDRARRAHHNKYPYVCSAPTKKELKSWKIIIKPETIQPIKDILIKISEIIKLL